MTASQLVSFTVVLLVLLVVVSAQAPRNRGRDRSNLRPRDRPRRSRSCRAEPVRLVTGRCTSPTDETWGQARFPQFSYGTPRSSEVLVDEGLLSPREISNIVFDQSQKTTNSHGLNLLFVFFAQFLDHNFAATPELEGPDDRADIEVPASDPDLRGRRTLTFHRSERALLSDGRTYRPINILTSALDLVAVYGPSEARSAALIEPGTGKLKTSDDGKFMPLNTGNFFNAPDTSNRFFFAGDHRPNEHPALTAMHTIFLREHNRLVDVIKNGSQVSADEAFEAARYINMLQFQKIVLEEFYPAIAGKSLPRYRFDRFVDPTLSDIFAGAAFRIGHTMVSNELPQADARGFVAPLPMARIFFNTASTFTTERLENTLRGISRTRAEEVDAQVVDLLRNQLFENVDDVEGFDLVALNLQRGRDHALPKYNEIRTLFGLPRKTSFDEITSNLDLSRRLSTAYQGRIDDVEAFVGLLAEDRLRGAGFGETMAAVWEEEFIRLRNGDQFLYKQRRRTPRVLRRDFTDLLREVRRPNSVSLRDIILRNTDITDSQLTGGNIFKS